VSDQHHRRDRVRTSPAVSKEVVSPSNNALDVRCDHIVFPSDAINARSRLINSIALCEDGINDSMHHVVANVITTPTSTSNIEHQTAYVRWADVSTVPANRSHHNNQHRNALITPACNIIWQCSKLEHARHGTSSRRCRCWLCQVESVTILRDDKA